MPTALEILNDPNYINANEATKRAIFNRHVASSPDYQNANAQTQDQIRRRFQITPSTPAQRYLGVPEPAAPRAPSTPAERYMRPQERRGVSMTPDQRQRERANPTPTVSREAAVLSGLERGLRGPAEFVSRLDPTSYLANAAEDFFRPGAREQIEAQLASQAQTMQQQRPQSFGGGRLAGELLGTVPLTAVGGNAIAVGGARVAQNAPRLGALLQQFGAATASGGLGTGRTAAQTAAIPLVERGGQLGVRMLGGGTAGATAAGITGQDVSEGFQFGAGLPVVGSLVRNLTGRVVDLGRMPALAAARILRESLENNVDRARELFAQMSPGDRRLAEQVMIEAGIEPRPFFGVGRTVQEQINPTQFAQRLEEQAAAREAGLAQAAGGGTVEATRATARQGRADVTNEMGPLREDAFARTADVNAAEVLAAEARQRARTAGAMRAQMEDEARRLTGAATYFGESPAFVRGADAVMDRATAAGRTAAEQDAIAREMEDFVYQAAAEGVEPLRGAPLVAALRTMAGQPGTRMDDLQRGTINAIADKIERGMDQNGMVNPYDMYQLRKTGVSDLIGEFQSRITAGNAPTSGNLQRTSQLAGDVERLIDDALGPQFRDYLDRSAQGYAAVNRQELAGEAQRLYQEAPEEFLRLVGGQRPGVVSSIMRGGPANESFSGVMASDPRRLLPIQNAAREVTTLNRMGELRNQGTASANNILRQARPGTVVRGLAATGLSPFPVARISLSGGGQIADKMEGQMIRQAQQRLSDAYFNPQSMSRLLNTFSTGSRVGEQISNIPRVYRNAMVQGALPSGVPEGGMVFGYGVTEDGQQYPMIEMPDGRIIHQTPAGNR